MAANLARPDLKLTSKGGACAVMVPADYRGGVEFDIELGTGGACRDGLLSGRALLHLRQSAGPGEDFDGFFVQGYPVSVKDARDISPWIGRFRSADRSGLPSGLDVLVSPIGGDSDLGFAVHAYYVREIGLAYAWCNGTPRIFVETANEAAFQDDAALKATIESAARLVRAACRDAGAIKLLAGPDRMLGTPFSDTGFLQATLRLRDGVWSTDPADSDYHNFAMRRQGQQRMSAAIGREQIASAQKNWDRRVKELEGESVVERLTWALTSTSSTVGLAGAALHLANWQTPIPVAAVVKIDGRDGGVLHGGWPRPFEIRGKTDAVLPAHGWALVVGAATPGKPVAVQSNAARFEIPLVLIDAKIMLPCERERCAEALDAKAMVQRKLGPRPDTGGR